MSSLYQELLNELRSQQDSSVEKTATAPSEPQSPESNNADILQVSQEMVSKIDNFLQQLNGMGTDESLNNQQNADGEPIQNQDGGQPNGQTVKLEVPAGVSVKVASEVNDGESALKTIIGLMPGYFGE